MITSGTIMVGNRYCNAACPWCCSVMLQEPVSPGLTINEEKFYEFRDMLPEGAYVVLSSEGDPMAHASHVNWYLNKGAEKDWTFMLQTNGLGLNRASVKSLESWRQLKLNVITLTIAHPDPRTNNALMQMGETDFDYWETIAMLQRFGFEIELACMTTTAGVNDIHVATNLMNRAVDAGVRAIYFRDLETDPGPCNILDTPLVPEVVAAAKDHYVPLSSELVEWLTAQDKDDDIDGLMVVPTETPLLPDMPSVRVAFQISQKTKDKLVITMETPPDDVHAQAVFWGNGLVNYLYMRGENDGVD